MPNKDLLKKLKRFFKNCEFIDFAFVFGSYAKDKVLPMSDLDIAIHTSKELELLEIGRIIAELEKLTQKEVDLVILNEIYKQNPLLAYTIVNEGIVVFCKDEEKLIEFKTNCLIWFFDHQPLYEMVNEALIERIKEGNFAKRNFRKD